MFSTPEPETKIIRHPPDMEEQLGALGDNNKVKYKQRHPVRFLLFFRFIGYPPDLVACCGKDRKFKHNYEYVPP